MQSGNAVVALHQKLGQRGVAAGCATGLTMSTQVGLLE
jgi:hypothetical protein